MKLGSRAWARSCPYDRDPWIAAHGPNTYFRSRLNFTRTWLDDPAVCGGGILLHTGVHSFDLVRLLTGREVVRAWCRTARAHSPAAEASDAIPSSAAGR